MSSAQFQIRFKAAMYAAMYNRPLINLDPSGLITISPDDNWDPEDFKDALDTIKDTIDDILEDPPLGEDVGFPLGPDDIIGTGTDVIDIMIGFVFKAGNPNSSCGKWVKEVFRCTICTTATCGNSCCASLAPRDHHTYPAGSLWGACLDSLVDGKLPAVHEKLKVKFWTWAEKLKGNCNKAPSKSKCCMANRKGAFVPIPKNNCPTKCTELRKKCSGGTK